MIKHKCLPLLPPGKLINVTEIKPNKPEIHIEWAEGG